MNATEFSIVVWIVVATSAGWVLGWTSHRHAIGWFGCRLVGRWLAMLGVVFLIGLMWAEYLMQHGVLERLATHRRPTEFSIARDGPFISSYRLSTGGGGVRDISDPLFGAFLYFTVPVFVLALIVWGTLWIVTSKPKEQPAETPCEPPSC